MKKVYVVVRRSPDTKDYMVEIMGIFSTEEAANERRAALFSQGIGDSWIKIAAYYIDP